jgi:hypothetical protein
MHFFSKHKQQPVPAPAPAPAPTRYCLIDIAPLLADLATRRIREQRARDFARYGIYYGQPLEELLRQNTGREI